MARFNGFQLGKELSRVKNLVHLLFRFLSLIKKRRQSNFSLYPQFQTYLAQELGFLYSLNRQFLTNMNHVAC